MGCRSSRNPHDGDRFEAPAHLILLYHNMMNTYPKSSATIMQTHTPVCELQLSLVHHPPKHLCITFRALSSSHLALVHHALPPVSGLGATLHGVQGAAGEARRSAW